MENDETTVGTPEEKLNPLERIAKLSRDFVRRYWNADADWCCEHAADTITMLLPGKSMTLTGSDALRAQIAQAQEESPRVILMNERYSTAPYGEKTFCTTGTCMAYVSSAIENFQERALHSTLVWQREDTDDPLVTHLHLSLNMLPSPRPAHDRRKNASENEPARRLVQAICAEDAHNLMLRDETGAVHYLNTHDILYLEAHGRRTTIHHRMGALPIPRGIGSLTEEVGAAFIPLHRSYVVNAFCIGSLSLKGCMLDDGTRLPVPARRFAEIKEAVARARGCDTTAE